MSKWVLQRGLWSRTLERTWTQKKFHFCHCSELLGGANGDAYLHRLHLPWVPADLGCAMIRRKGRIDSTCWWRTVEIIVTATRTACKCCPQIVPLKLVSTAVKQRLFPTILRQQSRSSQSRTTRLEGSQFLVSTCSIEYVTCGHAAVRCICSLEDAGCGCAPGSQSHSLEDSACSRQVLWICLLDCQPGCIKTELRIFQCG